MVHTAAATGIQLDVMVIGRGRGGNSVCAICRPAEKSGCRRRKAMGRRMWENVTIV